MPEDIIQIDFDFKSEDIVTIPSDNVSPGGGGGGGGGGGN